MKRALLAALVLAACRRAAPEGQATAPASAPTAMSERIAAVFPRGVGTEHAVIGTAPAPPRDDAPDPSVEWVADIALPAPRTAAQVLAAAPPAPEPAVHTLEGQTPAGEWAPLGSDGDPVDRVAVVVDNLDDVAVVTPAILAAEDAWARALATRLGAPPPPAPTLDIAHATARLAPARALRAQLSDADLEVEIVVAAPAGQKLAGRAVWDAVYSAGFTWGDGYFFHWLPAPDTDAVHGIAITSSTTRYFTPESIPDGRGDTADLRLAFRIPDAWHPREVLEVAIRAADYLARRLGGTVLGADGAPFEPDAARARVNGIEQAMLAAGVTPGSARAQRLF